MQESQGYTMYIIHYTSPLVLFNLYFNSSSFFPSEIILWTRHGYIFFWIHGYMDQGLDSNLNLSDSIMSTKPILFTARWAYIYVCVLIYKGLFSYLTETRFIYLLLRPFMPNLPFFNLMVSIWYVNRIDLKTETLFGKGEYYSGFLL